MTIKINTKGLDAFSKYMKKDLAETNYRFIVSKSLNALARQTIPTANAVLAQQIDKPTPFTQKSFRIIPSNKTKLVSTLTLKNVQADYLKLQFEGGTRRAKNKYIAIGGPGRKPNKYGNYPAKRNLDKLLRVPGTFIGNINGIEGIWRRSKGRSRKVSLLFVFSRTAQYDSKISLDEIGRGVLKSANRKGRAIIGKEIANAIGTSRLFK